MFGQVVFPTPWLGRSTDQWAALRQCVPHDRASLVLVDPSKPDAAGLLDGRGLTRQSVADWLNQCAKGDPLLKRAARLGAADDDSKDGVPVAAMKAEGHFLSVAIPAGPGSKRVWALTLMRKSGGFTDSDRLHLCCAIDQIRLSFEHQGSRLAHQMCVLIDAQGGVMLMDSKARAPLHCDTSPMESLAQQALEVIAHRWPKLETGRSYDLFIRHNDESVWVRVCMHKPIFKGIGSVMAMWVRPLDDHGPPAVGLMDEPRINKALAVLVDTYQTPRTLDQLAKPLQLSQFHFQRMFSAKVGVSPKYYTLRVQLIQARWMLRAKDTPIAEIASACGFGSHGHFTTTFHRLLGIQPTEYRTGKEPKPAR